MNLADAKSALWNPAILLASVPFVRFIIEFVFRWVFKNSTVESFERAATSTNTETEVRNAVADDKVRASLALYVDNDSDLEEFFQTSFFSALSLVVWLLTAQNKEGYQQVINIVLLFVIVVALVIVGIWSWRKYESAKRDAAKYPRCFAYGLALVILTLECVSTFTEH